MLIEIKKFLIDTVPGIFSMHRVLVNSRPGSRNFKSSEKKKKLLYWQNVGLKRNLR